MPRARHRKNLLAVRLDELRDLRHQARNRRDRPVVNDPNRLHAPAAFSTACASATTASADGSVGVAPSWGIRRQ
ncbi:hypothetical protein D3C72_2350250 [compost metagenome]